MSVYCNGVGDVLSASQALTIGTGDVVFAVWHRFDNVATTLSAIMGLTDDPSPTTRFQLYQDTAPELNGRSNTTYATTSYALANTTWYWLVVERQADGDLSLRVFDDSTSTTPLATVTTAGDGTNYTTIDTILLGRQAGNLGASIGLYANAKVHTGVTWSDAEARTEAQYYGIQKSGGTDRLCWRLKDIDADTDGLYEIGGAGPNLTNSGAIADAGAPTNLSEAGGGSIGFDDGDGPVSMTIQRAGPMIRIF